MREGLNSLWTTEPVLLGCSHAKFVLPAPWLSVWIPSALSSLFSSGNTFSRITVECGSSSGSFVPVPALH